MLGACTNANGEKGTVFNPLPYTTKPTDPKDVISATSETIIAGMGIVDRQILSGRGNNVLDRPTYRALDYAGHLPNGGLLPIWKVWADACAARGGEWWNPVCWSAGRASVAFLTEAYVSQSGQLGDELVLRVLDPKTGVDQEAFLAAAAGEVRNLSVLKFSTTTRLAKLQAADGQDDELRRGFAAVPGFSAITSDAEAQLAARALVEALDNRTRNAGSYLFGTDVFMDVHVTGRTLQGPDECATISATRGTSRHASAVGDLSKIASGDNGVRSTKNMLCKSAADRDGLTWRWVS
jgi:hypothetical protein